MKPFCYNVEQSLTYVLYQNNLAEIRSRPISRLCYENHYMTKSVDTYIRKKYENDFPYIIKKVIKNKTHTVLTKEEQHFFLEYLCISKFRLPDSRKNLANTFEIDSDEAKKTQEKLVLDQSMIEYELSKYKDFNFCTILNETDLPLVSHDPPIKEIFHDFYPNLLNILLTQDLTSIDFHEIIEKMKGEIIKEFKNIGQETLDTTLSLILSPNIVIKTSKQELPDKITVTDQKVIEYKNLDSFVSSSLFVFSPSKKPLRLIMETLRIQNMNQKNWGKMKRHIDEAGSEMLIPFSVKKEDIIEKMNFNNLIPFISLNIDNDGYKSLNKARAIETINQLELIKKKFKISEKLTLELLDSILSLLVFFFDLE